MKNHIFLATVLFFSSTQALAQVTVSKISADPIAIGLTVAPNSALKVGDALDLKTPTGEVCVVTVSKVTPLITFADSTCPKIAEVAIGTVVSPHVITADEVWSKELSAKQQPIAAPTAPTPAQASAPAPVPEAPPPASHNFGFGLYYSLADTLEEKGAINGINFSGETETSTGAGLSLYYNNVKAGSAGSYITLDHEFDRKGEEYVYDIGGTTYSGSDTGEYGMTLLASSIGFGSSAAAMFYGGINLPLKVSVEGASDYVDYSGKIGYQVGAQFHGSDRVDFGLEYRCVNIRSTYNDGVMTGTSNIKYNGAVVRFGVRF